jgi:hypothetical protein
MRTKRKRSPLKKRKWLRRIRKIGQNYSIGLHNNHLLYVFHVPDMKVSREWQSIVPIH